MLGKEDLKILHSEFIDKFDMSEDDIKMLENECVAKTLNDGELTYFNHECLGYIIVKSGVLRAYISSENFKEIILPDGEQKAVKPFCVLRGVQRGATPMANGRVCNTH